MSEAFEGGCGCGAVRYRLTSAPMFVQCCHCLDCQRQTGSAFVLNGLIEADRIEVLSGEPQPVAMPAPSGGPHDIYRCPTCATALWSDYSRRGVMLFVRIATLDCTDVLQPGAHIFTRSKVPWITLPPDMPAFEVYYDTATLWPEESLARRRAIFPDAPKS